MNKRSSFTVYEPEMERELAKISRQMHEEEWQNMPKWKKVLVYLFAITVPFIASIESVSF